MDLGTILGEYIISIAFIVVGIVCAIGVYIIFKNRSGFMHKKKLLFEDFNVGKYSIILFRKIGDKYHEIERVKMNIKTDEGFRYHNKDFKTFSLNDIAYTDKSNNYYAFDFDSGSQLTFRTKGMPDKISIDEVDIYVNRHVIEQLVKGLEELKPKGQWVLLIVGIALGLAMGIIAGIYLAPTITGSATQITPTPTPPIL